MERIQLLAAELYSYSFQNYKNHLGIGNVRFDEWMPRDARATERAFKEGWKAGQLAREIDTEPEHAQILLDRFEDAVEIVDAEKTSGALRNALRQSFEDILADCSVPPEKMEELIEQACYRVSDFLFLLEAREESIQKASDQLREES